MRWLIVLRGANLPADIEQLPTNDEKIEDISQFVDNFLVYSSPPPHTQSTQGTYSTQAPYMPIPTPSAPYPSYMAPSPMLYPYPATSMPYGMPSTSYMALISMPYPPTTMSFGMPSTSYVSPPSMPHPPTFMPYGMPSSQYMAPPPMWQMPQVSSAPTFPVSMGMTSGFQTLFTDLTVDDSTLAEQTPTYYSGPSPSQAECLVEGQVDDLAADQSGDVADDGTPLG